MSHYIMAIWSVLWLSILSGHSAQIGRKTFVRSRFSLEGPLYSLDMDCRSAAKHGGNYFVDFVRVYCNLKVLSEIESKWPPSFSLSCSRVCFLLFSDRSKEKIKVWEEAEENWFPGGKDIALEKNKKAFLDKCYINDKYWCNGIL